MGISIWQLIIIGLILSVTLWPCMRILNRAGFTRWWSLLIFVPIVNVIMVWVFAFSEWPISNENA